jgi:hypothetical protein
MTMISAECRILLIDTVHELAPEPQQVLRIQNIINTARAGAWNSVVPVGAPFFDAIPLLVNSACAQGWLQPLVLGLLDAFPSNQNLAKVLQEVTHEVTREETEVKLSTDDPEAPIHLLRETIARNLGDSALEVSTKLVERLASANNISGADLFDATRFAVEYHLLFAEELSAVSLMDIAYGRHDEGLEEFRRLLHEALEKKAMRDIVLEVHAHRFFSRALEREEDWYAYFNAVRRLCDPNPTIGSSLCRVRTGGFVAPQFLIAGILPHFEDNWRPIITVYERQMEGSQSAFHSFQASQWNTWLMWGPSIPICQCKEWEGIHALQYGYGDENNSMPIVGGAQGAPVSFESTPGGYDPKDPQAGAVFRQVSGRLRWAPWLLQRSGFENAPDRSGEIALPGISKTSTARAQRLIYEKDRRGTQRDGIVLQVEEVSNGDVRSYFTAYLWLMFLVARKPAEPGQAPRRLVDSYPSPNARSIERMPKCLWRELLPVYVHANIADAKALAMHRRALVGNALTLLRRLWIERQEQFPDAAAELCFSLVGGSDYAGCGSPLRFAPGDPLVKLLREQLAAETDREFAASVLLPADDETPASRPPQLAQFYSACRLPDLVADYYEYVKQLKLD